MTVRHYLSTPLLAELIQQEVASGWLEEVPDLAHAQERWGQVNVVSAKGRKPRLVVDNTVCGTNDACAINESYSLPMLSSVRHSFPMREFAGTASAFSIDMRRRTKQFVCVSKIAAFWASALNFRDSQPSITFTRSAHLGRSS